MLSNRPTAAILFLTAVTAIAIQRIAPRPIGLAAMLFLVIAIPLFLVYRRFRRKINRAPSVWNRRAPSMAIGRMGLLCAVAAVGVLCLSEFKDHQARKLPVFKQALAVANSSASATALLGSPIEASWPVKREGDLSDDAQEVHVIIPVRGRNEKGELTVDAIKEANGWKITRLLVAGGDRTAPAKLEDIAPGR